MAQHAGLSKSWSNFHEAIKFLHRPGRKRAFEAQVREQLSFLPFLLQVSVARGDIVPAKHIISSEEQA